MPKEKIELQYLSPYDPVEITYDGLTRYALATEETFIITPSKRTFKMVSLDNTDYFSLLRTKLGWSGRVRYSELTFREEDRS